MEFHFEKALQASRLADSLLKKESHFEKALQASRLTDPLLKKVKQLQNLRTKKVEVLCREIKSEFKQFKSLVAKSPQTTIKLVNILMENLRNAYEKALRPQLQLLYDSDDDQPEICCEEAAKVADMEQTIHNLKSHVETLVLYLESTEEYAQTLEKRLQAHLDATQHEVVDLEQTIQEQKTRMETLELDLETSKAYAQTLEKQLQALLVQHTMD